MRLYKASIFFCISGLLFSGFSGISYSKQNHALGASLTSIRRNADTRQLRTFERQLTPFFEIKARGGGTSANLKNSYAPSQGDLFMIARYWSRLSSAFKALYLQSLEIPSNMKMHPSPGGNFEIYYATSGNDSVDVTDIYGIGSWRFRTSGPNGVPDYIDDVAWAFDSAWSMEIDGFQFNSPLPYIDNLHPSGRVKIIVRELDFIYDSGTYGMTTPTGTAGGATIGQRCYIEIRNEWKGFDQPDYFHHPEQAVHVTAVHEFFHAIQFAMTRSLNGTDEEYLDDFSLSWLEGTAGLMENIGFDSVDDYIQYTGHFFEDPTSTIFNNDAYSAYTTVLLALFLYERLEEKPSITFIKRIFFNNYSKYIDFVSNLDSTSKTFNRTWTDILGDFYTQSYFTGKRARPNYFIHDAPLLQEWSAASDSLGIGYSMSKEVVAFGMRPFFLAQQKYPFHDGTLSFFGDSAPPASPFWGLHCILQSEGDTADSVFSLPVSNSGKSRTKTTNWSRFTGALIIVSNAYGDKNHRGTLVFESCPITLHSGDSIFLNGKIVAPLSPVSSISVSVKAHDDLTCSLSINSASLSPFQRNQAMGKKLEWMNVFYAINFPQTWSTSATMKAAIAEDASSFIPLENKSGISSSAFAIFHWDDIRGDWEKDGAATVSGNTYLWNFAITTPGFYGLFAQMPGAIDTVSRISVAAYPNPVRQNADMRFRANGKVLIQLLVYSMKGSLIYRWETANPVDTLKWNLTNTSGRSVVPGLYYASVGYKDPRTMGITKKKQKVLIIP